MSVGLTPNIGNSVVHFFFSLGEQRKKLLRKCENSAKKKEKEKCETDLSTLANRSKMHFMITRLYVQIILYIYNWLVFYNKILFNRRVDKLYGYMYIIIDYIIEWKFSVDYTHTIKKGKKNVDHACIFGNKRQ